MSDYDFLKRYLVFSISVNDYLIEKQDLMLSFLESKGLLVDYYRFLTSKIKESNKK